MRKNNATRFFAGFADGIRALSIGGGARTRRFFVSVLLVSLVCGDVRPFMGASVISQPEIFTASDSESLLPSTQIDPVAASTPGFEDWWGNTQKEVAAMEYKPSLQTADAEGKELVKPSWHMANRAHDLRSYVNADGWTIQPRSPEASQWHWTYELASVGRGSEKVKLKAASEKDVTAGDDGRVTIDRRTIHEWYENSVEGIEQGFTVPERPSGDGPLEVVAAIDTSLNVSSKNDDKITFSTDKKDVLSLSGLKVWDATGRTLSSRFIHDRVRSTLTIAVADEGAVYPVTIDPLATSPAWTVESNQANSSFGNSVASAGDVNGDGYADVIVGAPSYDNGQTDEGRAFVYHGSASGLSGSANWTEENDVASSNFGYRAASAGDVNGDGYADVIVGAGFYTNGQSLEGRAYVFHGSASGLSVSENWGVESNVGGVTFGLGVASAGDVNGDGYSDVIVGANNFSNGQSNEGRAFVYHGSASGLSTSAAWTAESDVAGAHFGLYVASAGDVNGDGYSDVIVGAQEYSNGQSNEGRAYVYHGSASGLSASAAWTVESNQVNASLGQVAGAGDVNGDGYADVIVGATGYTNGQTDEGRAFVYHGSASGLSGSANWTAESDLANAYFGDRLHQRTVQRRSRVCLLRERELGVVDRRHFDRERSGGSHLWHQRFVRWRCERRRVQ